jgi:hypothetical protein
MKTLLIITSLFISSVQVYSQQGSDYFPPGTQYTYKAVPLDSLNDPITSEMFYRRDFFTDIAQHEGKLANIFLTKNASEDSIGIVPYLDSLFLHFDGTDGFEYFQTGNLEGILRSLDSLGIDPNFIFLDFFRSLEDWYSIYRFSAAVNNEYNLLTIDTTIIIFPTKFEYTGERFPDETVNTTLHGPIDCKKFLVSWNVSANIFGNWIDLLTTKDTLWIAPGNEFWIVQEHVPTNHVVLPAIFGIDPISIPGLKTYDPEIIIVSVEDEQVIPTEISLEQNYPNPFNPSTSIQYTISDRQFVSLKVYDIIGNEVATMVNSEKPAGVYEVEWNASDVPSGVYFYQLKTGSFVQTKKMLLLK